MDIEFLRDLVIIIFGVVTSGVLILLAALAFSVYRQIRLMQKSMSKTLSLVEAFASTSHELGKTLSQASSIIPGIRDRVSSFIRAFTNPSGGEDNE
jgi:hypothetical protein